MTSHFENVEYSKQKKVNDLSDGTLYTKILLIFVSHETLFIFDRFNVYLISVFIFRTFFLNQKFTMYDNVLCFPKRIEVCVRRKQTIRTIISIFIRFFF